MLSFRNAEKSDLDKLIEPYHPKDEQKRVYVKELQEKRIELGLEPGNEFVIACMDDLVVGHVLVEKNKMKALFVEEIRRNQGIGTKIIQEVEKRLRERGFATAELSVNPDENRKAQELYERLSYRIKNSKKYLEYVDPYDGKEDWVIDLSKDLGIRN